jgi:predicted PurR-regulated permease PerM
MEKAARVLKLILIVAAAAATIVFLWTKISGLICTLIISAIAAYLLNKPLKLLEKKMKRPWALLIIFGVLVAAAAFSVYYFVPLFFRQAADLIAYIPRILQTAGSIVGSFGSNAGEPLKGILSQTFQGIDQKAAGWLSGATLRAAHSLSAGLGWTLLFPFFAFYFLKDHEYFIDQLGYLVPIRYRADMHALYLLIDKAIGQFLRGQLLVSITVAVLVTIGLIIVGVPNALLLGLICGLFNMIPYIGPFIGVIPVALVAAVLGWEKMLFAMLVVFAVQQIDNMIISPKVIGDSIRIHPAYTIIAIIAGSGIFGILGLLFALPMLIILKEIITFVFRKRLHSKKEQA